MTWTARQTVALPISMLESANRLAALIDPDTGGALTFSADQTIGDLIVAYIPYYTEFWPIVERRNPAEWKAVMAQVAAQFGREPLDDATVELLCAAMLLNDEVSTETLNE